MYQRQKKGVSLPSEGPWGSARSINGVTHPSHVLTGAVDLIPIGLIFLLCCHIICCCCSSSSSSSSSSITTPHVSRCANATYPDCDLKSYLVDVPSTFFCSLAYFSLISSSTRVSRNGRHSFITNDLTSDAKVNFFFAFRSLICTVYNVRQASSLSHLSA